MYTILEYNTAYNDEFSFCKRQNKHEKDSKLRIRPKRIYIKMMFCVSESYVKEKKNY